MTRVDANLFQQTFDRIKQQMARVVVGQQELVEGLLVAAIAKGHVLVEGAPGLGKTLVARTLAVVSGCAFKRIQFTPDLMPSDITGLERLQPRDRAVHLRGRAHLRAAPAGRRDQPRPGQDAERAARGDAGPPGDRRRHSRPLPAPFVVVATQNPVESQGTYPLARGAARSLPLQADGGRSPARDRADDRAPPRRRLRPDGPLGPAGGDLALRRSRRCSSTRGSVRVDDAVIAYIVELVRRTRDDKAIELGASPRASIALLKAAQVIAASEGRTFVTPDDVKPMVAAVLRHRVMLAPGRPASGDVGRRAHRGHLARRSGAEARGVAASLRTHTLFQLERQIGLTFSALGPFGPWPSVNETRWPCLRSSNRTP